MKQQSLTKGILGFCISFLLIVYFSSCSKEPGENEPNTPNAIIPCSVLNISKDYDSSAAKKLEFANLHNDFLNEMTHALVVIKIIFTNQDKTLARFRNKNKEQINTFITLAEIGPDVFDDMDVSTIDDTITSKKLATRIANHELYDASSEHGQLVSEIVSHANNLTDLAFEIQRYLDEENMESEGIQANVTQLLENSATLFDCIANKHIALNKNISDSNVHLNDVTRLEYKLSPLLNSVRELSQAVISENLDIVTLWINQIKNNLGELDIEEYNLDDNQTLRLNDAISQIEEMIIALENGDLDTESEDCYSDGYVKYNRLVLRYVNSISPGFVRKINDVMLQRYDSHLKYVELPQYYELLSR